jgi:hypothetical protein
VANPPPGLSPAERRVWAAAAALYAARPGAVGIPALARDSGVASRHVGPIRERLRRRGLWPWPGREAPTIAGAGGARPDPSEAEIAAEVAAIRAALGHRLAEHRPTPAELRERAEAARRRAAAEACRRLLREWRCVRRGVARA